MMFPGFTAETSLYRVGSSYRGAAAASGARFGQHLTPAADSCVCTSPNCQWSCPVTTPPDCTTTGCRPGLVCCDCVGPPRCTTPAICNRLCRL